MCTKGNYNYSYNYVVVVDLLKAQLLSENKEHHTAIRLQSGSAIDTAVQADYLAVAPGKSSSWK